MIMALGEKMTVENSDVSKVSTYESQEIRFL